MDNFLLYAVAITALIVSDVLLVLLGIFYYRRQHQGDDGELRQTVQAIQDDQETLLRELRSLADQTETLNGRLQKIETKLTVLQDAAEKTPLSSHKQADHKAYEVAAKLVQEGAGVDELMKLCGLARGEAELIRRLHGGDGAGEQLAS